MSLLDVLFKNIPDYDADNDPLATPDEREVKDLPLHVRQCARRFGDLKQSQVATAQQLQSTQKLLVIVIVLLLANKVIDVSSFTGWLSP
jgi:hypothetical protein